MASHCIIKGGHCLRYLINATRQTTHPLFPLPKKYEILLAPPLPLFFLPRIYIRFDWCPLTYVIWRRRRQRRKRAWLTWKGEKFFLCTMERICESPSPSQGMNRSTIFAVPFTVPVPFWNFVPFQLQFQPGPFQFQFTVPFKIFIKKNKIWWKFQGFFYKKVFFSIFILTKQKQAYSRRKKERRWNDVPSGPVPQF